MPELPEVETVRQSLLPEVIGRTVEKIEMLTAGVLIGHPGAAAGLKISGIDRRGKYLLFKLQNSTADLDMIVHLRMTGRILIRHAPWPVPRHTHVRIQLSGQNEAKSAPLWLIFVDPRRFGRIWLARDRQDWPKGLLGLGPEPLDDPFDHSRFRQALKRRQTSIKGVLLDQKVLAGLGNIYADESLFAAGIRPDRSAATLSGPEADRLADSVRQTLDKAIACQGTTLRDYADGWNRSGSFQDCLMAYGRGGAPCRQCGERMEQARIAGRTTTWCPKCQPLKRNRRKGTKK